MPLLSLERRALRKTHGMSVPAPSLALYGLDNPIFDVHEGDLQAFCRNKAGDRSQEVIVMKFIVEVAFPLEPFNTYVRKGIAGEKIAEVLGHIKPEVAYFTDSGVGRGAMMVVEVESASRVPHITEPLMLNFDASVHYRAAITPEELRSAGLEEYAATGAAT